MKTSTCKDMNLPDKQALQNPFSVQNKIIIKQCFSFYNIQLVLMKSLRKSWTSSFLTDNFEKSAMLHNSTPLHHGKSVIFPLGKVPTPFNLYFNMCEQGGKGKGTVENGVADDKSNQIKRNSYTWTQQTPEQN